MRHGGHTRRTSLNSSDRSSMRHGSRARYHSSDRRSNGRHRSRDRHGSTDTERLDRQEISRWIESVASEGAAPDDAQLLLNPGEENRPSSCPMDWGSKLKYFSALIRVVVVL